MKTISLEQLKAAVHYNPETGLFTWLSAVKKCNLVGKQAGHFNQRRGYWYITIKKSGFLSHRLAWALTTGAWPAGQVDHINGNREDNRFANLRDVSQRVNSQNRRTPQANNLSGFLGVRPHKKRWQAILTTNGKTTPLGTYDTPELAHQVYLQRKRIEHEGCTL